MAYQLFKQLGPGFPALLFCPQPQSTQNRIAALAGIYPQVIRSHTPFYLTIYPTQTHEDTCSKSRPRLSGGRRIPECSVGTQHLGLIPPGGRGSGLRPWMICGPLSAGWSGAGRSKAPCPGKCRHSCDSEESIGIGEVPTGGLPRCSIGMRRRSWRGSASGSRMCGSRTATRSPNGGTGYSSSARSRRLSGVRSDIGQRTRCDKKKLLAATSDNNHAILASWGGLA